MKKAILIGMLVACGRAGISTTTPILGAGSSGGSSSGASSGSSSGSSAGATSLPVVTRDQFFTQLTALVCPAIASTCSSDGYAYSLANCQLGLAAFADPGANATTLDPRAAATCLATPVSDNTGATGLDSSSARVFIGTLAAGSTCTTAGECAPPASGTASCDSSFCAIHTTDGVLGATCGQKIQRPQHHRPASPAATISTATPLANYRSSRPAPAPTASAARKAWFCDTSAKPYTCKTALAARTRRAATRCNVGVLFTATARVSRESRSARAAQRVPARPPHTAARSRRAARRSPASRTARPVRTIQISSSASPIFTSCPIVTAIFGAPGTSTTTVEPM